MNFFKRFFALVLVCSLFLFLSGFSLKGLFSKKAANPCSQNMKNVCNPCNPCGKKMNNPCNPCGKTMKNPCNPCGGGFLDEPANPCAAVPEDQINFFRDVKFKSLDKVIAYGEKLANDPALGNSGKSCNECHKGGRAFKKSFLLPYPHYVKMPKDVVTLDQMINFCMINPMKADPLPYGSREMTAIAAYVMKVYPQEYAANRASNPCAGKNPCAANPCAGNPCSMK